MEKSRYTRKQQLLEAGKQTHQSCDNFYLQCEEVMQYYRVASTCVSDCVLCNDVVLSRCC